MRTRSRTADGAQTPRPPRWLEPWQAALCVVAAVASVVGGQLVYFAWQLVPGSGARLPTHTSLAALNLRLSERSVFTARICYPEESGLPEGHRHGTLVVAKASLTPSLPYQLLSYAARYPVFPFDSTGDQFFDDGKFTAYSALGRALGEEAAAAMLAARRARWPEQPGSSCGAGRDARPAPQPVVEPSAAPAQRSSGSPV